MRRCREVGGVDLQEREGEEDHMPIKAMLACVWGSHIGNTSVPSLDSTMLHHTACMASHVHLC